MGPDATQEYLTAPMRKSAKFISAIVTFRAIDIAHKSAKGSKHCALLRIAARNAIAIGNPNSSIE